ncbi:MAG: serine/threonine protein kinase [Myxococcales bacterium]|nr:serine/threonine protein kinase [Myxococcales bacterium]
MATDVRGQAVTVGRYILHRQIARGGMATIHIARLMGDEGFSRIVAAKRLLPEFAEDEEFVAMFLDEARIASKVHHRNVVPVLDVVTTGEEVVLVQEYVHGAPLHWLLKTARQAKTHVPLHIAVSIICQVAEGLHAAHETVDEMGAPLNIVHRDVSPQNVMVAIDGTARLLDFGVAKATMAAHVTRDGQFKGKLAYSAPEQLRGHATKQSDIYSLSVVLWELIVGHRMHQSSQGEAELVSKILQGALPTLTEALASEREWIGDNRWRQLEAIEDIIKKGLAVDVKDRWQTATELEEALRGAVPPASSTDVGAWLKALGKEFLEGRDKMLAAEEASWRRVALPVARRATPVSMASVRASQTHQIQQEDGTPSGAAQQMPRTLPAAPPRRGSTALIGGLSLAVVALAVGIVFVIKSGGSKVQPAAQPAVTDPTTPSSMPAAAAPAPVRVEATVPAAAVPAAAEPAPAAAAPTEIEAPPVAAPAVATPAPAPNRNVPSVTRKPPARPAPRQVVRVAQPPPRAVATQPPPRAVATPPQQPAHAAVTAPDPKPDVKPETKADCNPPYYYEGSKKIFKPSCI